MSAAPVMLSIKVRAADEARGGAGRRGARRGGAVRTADWHAPGVRGMGRTRRSTIPLGRTHLSYETVNVLLVNPQTVNKTITSPVCDPADHTQPMDSPGLEMVPYSSLITLNGVSIVGSTSQCLSADRLCSRKPFLNPCG